MYGHQITQNASLGLCQFKSGSKDQMFDVNLVLDKYF